MSDTRFIFEGLIGKGKWGEVWRARDTKLERAVAIKLFEPGATHLSSAVDHARALAGFDHPNIVQIFDVDELEHPKHREKWKAIIMQLLTGPTLSKLLVGAELPGPDASALCRGLVAGVAALHHRGIVHTDISGDNVMLGSDRVPRLIDVLYRGPVAAYSPDRGSELLVKDIQHTIVLLESIVEHSRLSGRLDGFRRRLTGVADVDGLSEALEQTLAAPSDPAARKNALTLFLDPYFSDSDEYGVELLARVPDDVVGQHLRDILKTTAIQPKHGSYLRRLWSRQTPEQQSQALELVGEALLECAPSQWESLLIALDSVGDDVWRRVPRLGRLRAERGLLDEVSSGQHDIHGSGTTKGALGRWAGRFGRHFDENNRLALLEKLMHKLRDGWFTQNYVAHELFKELRSLCRTVDEQQGFVDAIRVAKRNDAKRVLALLRELPKSWQLKLDEGDAIIEPTTGLKFYWVDAAPFTPLAGETIASSGVTLQPPKRRISETPFWVARFPVTNPTYDEFVDATRHRPSAFRDDPAFNGASKPVVGVSWDDADAFCRWLGEQSGRRVALPTQAQWECAARCSYPWDDGQIEEWCSDPPELGVPAPHESRGGAPADLEGLRVALKAKYEEPERSPAAITRVVCTRDERSERRGFRLIIISEPLS